MFEIVHDHDGKHDDAFPKKSNNGIPEHPDTREEVTQGLDTAGDTAVLLNGKKVYGSLRGGDPHYIQYVHQSTTLKSFSKSHLTNHNENGMIMVYINIMI